MDGRAARVLAGDVGGTKVLLQIAEVGDGLRVVHERRFHAAVYDDFLPIVREFLQTAPGETGSTLTAACFGVAGPIAEAGERQRAQLTNLPWRIDTDDIAQVLRTSRVRLINDFQATGYGIEALRAEDLIALQVAPPRPAGVRIVIGAGTGLGQGILFWQDGRYEVFPTEGGHVDFAPTDELQVELWRYLRQHFDRVSYERVLSGPGLVTLYTFLREFGVAHESPELAAAMDSADPAAAIARAALSGNDVLAQNALEMFVSIYGAQAGNFALATLAYGGVYVAGGIAPKIINKMTDGTFMRAFRAKGRMSALVSAMPVYVVMNQNVGLLGAAFFASRL